MKKYYKVVSVQTKENVETFYSARSTGYDEEAATPSVQYIQNQWVAAPRNTRLFVFDKLADAKKFRRDTEAIFECSIVGGIKGHGAAYYFDVRAFWEVIEKLLKSKKAVDLNLLPDKIDLAEYPAILAKKVKLTKRIIN